jgi:hypothetical protein
MILNLDQRLAEILMAEGEAGHMQVLWSSFGVEVAESFLMYCP